jgi:hypothetical protein
MQNIATADQDLASPTTAFVAGLAMCPAALFAHLPASAPEMYRRAHGLAVQEVSRRFRARVFEPSPN